MRNAQVAKQASELTFETRLFINGQFTAAGGGATFDTLNPATGTLLAKVSAATVADVEAAVSAARAAFEGGPWRSMAPRERKKILLRFIELIEANSQELALIESLDNGKPYTDALTGDLPGTVELMRWHAEAMDKVLGQVTQAPEDIVSLVVKEPIGVVAAVIPWNFPLEIMANKLVPALASGNSLIIKPAEQTSLSVLRVATLANEAGIPPGVFNVLPGLGAVAGEALGRHRDVDCLSFTGSTEVGKYFLEYAAKSNLKRVFLELGGKSPAIVMDDVRDFARVAQQIAGGVIYSQGQICSGNTRLLVHRSVKAQMLEALQAEFAQWTVGDPLDSDSRIGASISSEHLDRVLGYIESARAEGATVVTGGGALHPESGGYYIAPTLLDNVDNRMRVAREEIFGPVLCVITFDTEAEAVRIANDSEFGLASSVYTNNLHVAHRLSKQLRAGTVSVNCFSEGDQAVPFGGYKQSGFGGREKSLSAFDIYTETKAVWIQLLDEA